MLGLFTSHLTTSKVTGNRGNCYNSTLEYLTALSTTSEVLRVIVWHKPRCYISCLGGQTHPWEHFSFWHILFPGVVLVGVIVLACVIVLAHVMVLAPVKVLACVMVLAHVMVLAPVKVLACVMVLARVTYGVSPRYGVRPCYGRTKSSPPKGHQLEARPWRGPRLLV